MQTLIKPELIGGGKIQDLIATYPNSADKLRGIEGYHEIVFIPVILENSEWLLLVTKIIHSYLGNLNNGLMGYSDLFFSNNLSIKPKLFQNIQRRIIQTILVLNNILRDPRIVFDKGNKEIKGIIFELIKNLLVPLAKLSYIAKNNPNNEEYWKLAENASEIIEARRKQIRDMPFEIDISEIIQKGLVKQYTKEDF